MKYSFFILFFIIINIGCENSVNIEDCNDFDSTFSLIDNDGDGLTDCEETTGLDNPNTIDVPEGISDPNDPFIGKIETVKNIGGSLNESIQSVTKTNDGGFICIGYTQSNDGDISNAFGANDYWVLKYNSNFELDWEKSFGGSSEDRAYKIIQLLDGSYLINGYSLSEDFYVGENNGQKDIWIVKLDTNGQIIWKKSFGFGGDEEGFSIIETIDGGILACGYLDVTASGGQGNSLMYRNVLHGVGDFWVIKMDYDGEVEWRRYYGGSNNDRAYDLLETDNGQFIIVGSTESNDFDISNSNGSYDFWIIKLSNKGELIDEYTFGGSEIDNCYKIIQNDSKSYILVGNTRSQDGDILDNKGFSDIWVINMSIDGEILWQKTYGGSSFDSASGICRTQDGHFMIVGNTRSIDGDIDKNKGQNDIWVLKINNDGKLKWQKTFGGTGYDLANDIIELKDKTIIVVGESNSSDFDISNNKGYTDAVILKIK